MANYGNNMHWKIEDIAFEKNMDNTYLSNS